MVIPPTQYIRANDGIATAWSEERLEDGNKTRKPSRMR